MALPRMALLRSVMLNHWYHHRGQLTMYLRELNVPIPSIYGPSADEKPFQEGRREKGKGPDAVRSRRFMTDDNAALTRAHEHALTFLRALPDRPVGPAASFEDLAARLGGSVPPRP